MTFDPKRLGLFFQPDPAAIAILEKSDREFGAAVGKVLAQIQDEIFECGLNGTIRRVVDGGTTLELVALIEHLRAHAFQITPDDIGADETGERLEVWRARARAFLSSVIGEGEPVVHAHANGHAALDRSPT